jgi:sarcosine oxidase subunit alpha
VLACEIPPDGRARIPRLDPLRPLARRAERMTPWFYERRFGSPRWLRQAYLNVLRRLSSAPRLPATPVARPRGSADRELERETDALVVGGGPAGLDAARALAGTGLRVLLVEREGRLGGSGRWREDRPPDEGVSPAVTVLTGTTCLGLYEEEDVAAIVGPDGPGTVRFDRLVVATGAYDRPLAFVGNDLPGTIGLRAFERYAAAGSFRDGIRVGVVAAPGEAARAVAAARAAGIALTFVAGPADVPAQDLRSFPERALDRVEGRGSVRSVQLQGETPIRCDVLVLGFTQPTFELQVQAGATASVAGEPAVVISSGDTRFPVLAVGEAAGHVEIDGAAVRAAVDTWMRGGDPVAPCVYEGPEAAVRHPDAFACLCEDVRVRDLTAAIEEGFTSAELVKRRTGAGTGPCQGAYCLGEISAVIGSAVTSADQPTVRPPMRPVSIAALGGVVDG